MSVPVGLSIPKLLPITGTFVLPLSAYYFYLQSRVAYYRVKTQKFIEQKGSEDEGDDLLAACRAQMNYAENIPLALTLAVIVELNGGSRKALTAVLSALLVFRVLHADFGLLVKNYRGPGRTVGFVGTQGVIAGLASYAAYLVKGYWDL